MRMGAIFPVALELAPPVGVTVPDDSAGVPLGFSRTTRVQAVNECPVSAPLLMRALKLRSRIRSEPVASGMVVTIVSVLLGVVSLSAGV